jgi:hydrogenase maturation protease
MTGKLLIAGVGNIFLGDDGFGVEVAHRLADVELPDWAHVVDYGIRGMHLAYDLANGYNSAILVDATARGGDPGTLYLIEPDLEAAPADRHDRDSGDSDASHNSQDGHDNEHSRDNDDDRDSDDRDSDAGSGLDDALAANPLFNAHGMQPDVVFSMLGMLDATERQVLVVGCEPASVDYGMGLSAPVAAAVDSAIAVILDLVADAAESGDEHQLVMKERAHVPRDSR